MRNAEKYNFLGEIDFSFLRHNVFAVRRTAGERTAERPGGTMVKLTDIARELNIAPSTVSKALNNTGRVSPELRKKVIQRAEEMNYSPNENARGLRTNKSTMIGVILPQIINSFFGKMLREINHAAREYGYSVFFCDSELDVEKEKYYYELLQSKNVCGMIIAPAGISDTYKDVSRKENLVFVDSIPSYEVSQPFVTINNYEAAEKLAEHLIGKGYRSIYMICSDIQDIVTGERMNGFLDAMWKTGCADGAKIARGAQSFEGGKKMMEEILRNGKPDAVIAENNFLAYGALSSIAAHGLSVPDDIALACFDGVDDFDMMWIDLTTVVQPVDVIGKKAVEMIVAKNESPGREPEPSRITVEYAFRPGNSS